MLIVADSEFLCYECLTICNLKLISKWVVLNLHIRTNYYVPFINSSIGSEYNKNVHSPVALFENEFD